MSENLTVRLLIVDDDPGILDVLTRFFELDDRVEEVVGAEGGEDAIKILTKDDRFDAVVCDERMPDMRGTKVLAHVRKAHPTMVRILMTGYQDQEAAIQAINQAKIHRYVSKPVELSTLSNVLFALVEDRYMERVEDADVHSARAMAKAIHEFRKRHIGEPDKDQ